MGPGCGTHGEEKMFFYTVFVAVIDRLEELVVDGIGLFELEFFCPVCFP